MNQIPQRPSPLSLLVDLRSWVILGKRAFLPFAVARTPIGLECSERALLTALRFANNESDFTAGIQFSRTQTLTSHKSLPAVTDNRSGVKTHFLQLAHRKGSATL